ncbi:cobaltochelatase subunit CobN [Methylobacillus gramineus]|uniref:cobaltochelatase subunit CobN n=1 Tax=Methylobacillus gramineus TaxID=755169 RepID=UPI001CFFF68C|nr:cobaltochelatase subunit CobN [Methylobacillus gramineus]MCB5185508.1 cobaltochelatase subunit CobN [Methylobacillus gramineus]
MMTLRYSSSLLYLLLCLSAPASAATLFGVVSDRTAPAAATAAHTALEASKGKDQIILRTQSQVLAADSRTLKRWLQQADAVFAIAVYAETSQQLQAQLDQLGSGKPKNFIAFNGDSALSLRSRWQGQQVSNFSHAKSLTLTQNNLSPKVAELAQQHPAASQWLGLHNLWQAGGNDNLATFMRQLLHPAASLPAIQPEQTLRLRRGGKELEQTLNNQPGPMLAVLDLSTSDPQPADAICAASEQRRMPCITIMARWGETSRDAIANLKKLLAPATPTGLVVLQDFVVGAAEGREAVTELLKTLDVPVYKAMRLTDRTASAWQLSEDGLPINSVQYRVAMPEIQGSSQPIVVAAAGPATLDKLTGVELKLPQILPAEVKSLVTRVLNWQKLQAKPNADKKVALIYYNHPPGRQNIGADNLDVPASLFDMLQALKKAGYTTGALPASQEALLDLMQERGVNLPEDNGALASMSQQVNSLDLPSYMNWFSTLAPQVRGEMVEGPLGKLHADLTAAQKAGEIDIARNRLDKAMHELRHLLEGADHPERNNALKQLDALNKAYLQCLDKHTDCSQLTVQKTRLAGLGIEGLRGWGQPPGKVMVHDRKLLIPGLQFGNIFIGPQPPRGWEVDEELLHANTTIPPPHQYLGFYHWLQSSFKADALVHIGRHSTYEFLPGKAVGLATDDYSRIIAGDLPGIYPYIVDGVGEGTQSKRRGLAVMIDHLTPPLTSTPLYDRLLELRQIVETYESSSSETMKVEAAREMRRLVEALQLRAELEASMADVLEVRGIGYEQTDDDLLAHEIGHYLTKLQEKFMPHGLHIFGRQWSDESLQLMLDSMARGQPDSVSQKTRDALAASPALEMQALLHALDGGFIAPGKGNDPLRSPESLPTGRNFHALDGDVLPTRIGFQIGASMATKVRERDSVNDSEGVILWASDAVRDEGVMVSFILSLMGIEPEWNARGIVQKMQLKPDIPRHDVIVTTSGLFRDLYPNLMQWIDNGGRLALAASAQQIRRDHPQLNNALTTALEPLAASLQEGSEPLASNGVALQWIRRTQAHMQHGQPAQQAGREAAWRIFGDAPGAYGTGVNRLTERSGTWKDRNELGNAYLTRMGHAYGMDAQGQPAQEVLKTALGSITNTYHGRASNLYGLIDNNDAFDYLGGLSLATETVTGKRPTARILNHTDADNLSDDPLETALLMELRGRYLNPAWIRPLMTHGYAGARTMGQEFLENLWGWQVTRPDIIKDWAWDEVKRVYMDDGLKLGLDKFLEKDHNAQVKAHMLAIMMVAAEKGYWHTDEATLRQLGSDLAKLVNKNGLPGSGHTAPNHPMWNWLMPYLDSADQHTLQQTLSKARGDAVPATYASQADTNSPATQEPAQSPIAEQVKPKIAPAKTAIEKSNTPETKPAEPRAYEIAVKTVQDNWQWLLMLLPIFIAGLWFGTRKPRL